jgi:hypothetical protein
MDKSEHCLGYIVQALIGFEKHGGHAFFNERHIIMEQRIEDVFVGPGKFQPCAQLSL